MKRYIIIVLVSCGLICLAEENIKFVLDSLRTGLASRNEIARSSAIVRFASFAEKTRKERPAGFRQTLQPGIAILNDEQKQLFFHAWMVCADSEGVVDGFARASGVALYY